MDQATYQQKAQKKIVMGDLNAKVGDSDEFCLGNFSCRLKTKEVKIELTIVSFKI